MIPRPASSEYPAAFGRYIDLVPDGELARFLEDQTRRLSKFLDALDEAQAGFRYAPEKWSIKELLGHINDSDRIFGYRILCIARGEKAPLPGYDDNAYVAAGAFDARSLADLLAEFGAIRRATISLVQSLTPQASTEMGTSNGRALSAGALAYMLAGHAEHHLGVLKERYLQKEG